MSKTSSKSIAELTAELAALTAEQEPATVAEGLKVGTVAELAPEQKAVADKLTAHIKTQVDAAVKAAVAESKANVTDPSTRPVMLAETAVKATEAADVARIIKGFTAFDSKKVFDSDVLTDEQRDAKLAERIAPNINYFPRGDMDNFRIERWSAALERNQNTLEGSTAFLRWAPWESQYYSAMARFEKASQAEFTSGQDGGYLAPQLWSNAFVDQIYASQALAALPVTVIPMANGVVHIPKLTTAVTVGYAAENASLTANNAQFAQVSFTARKQYIFVQISNELIRDSNPAAAQVIINNAQRWAAIDRDKQALIGNGQSGAPYGLVNATNYTTSTLTSASSPLFTELLTGMANVENLNNSSNVPVGQTTCTGVFGATALKQQILSMKDSNGRPIFDYGLGYLKGPNAPDASSSSLIDGLLGIPKWSFSNALGEAANSRHIIFGDWQHLWIMQRQDVELMTSNVAGTAFANDQTWVRLISRYDVAVVHPEAFFGFSNG